MRAIGLAVLGAVTLTMAGPSVASALAPTPSPSACPTPAASPANPTETPSPTPTASPGSVAALCAEKLALTQIRQRLGNDLAAGLAADDGLSRSLVDNAAQQSSLKSRIQAARAEIDRLSAEVDRLTSLISALTVKIVAEERQLGGVARAVYFSPDTLILRVVRAGSLRQALVATADMATLAARAQAIRQRVSQDRAQLATRRTEAALAMGQQAGMRSELEGALAALVQLRGQQEQTERQLSAKLASIRAELARVGTQDVSLAGRIAAQLQSEQQALIVAAMQQVWAQLTIWLQANQGPTGPHPGQPRFALPLRGAVITQRFGPSDLSIEPPYAGFAHFHAGLDLAAPQDTPVLAADDGVVAVVGSSSVGYGNYVVLAHAGGVASLYGHLDRSLVKLGDQLRQGQPLGLEGSTGNSTGPHLHFEVRIGGQPVDPLALLTLAPELTQ